MLQGAAPYPIIVSGAPFPAARPIPTMQTEIISLTKTFGGTRAVDGLSFSFGPGEVVGFVGPNGAGKTTTMRIMATLDEPDSGDILLDGVSILDYPEDARRHMGFMPDALPDYGDITAHEYIDFFGRAFRLRGEALARAVRDVEDFTGVGPIRDKTLKALSKGMKQRVSLARALVHDPDVLILDEPANGLDPRARIELRELVKALAETGKSILVSSHILTELAEMCTGYQIIERGRLLRGGTIGDIARGRRNGTRLFARAVGIPPEDIARKVLDIPGVVKAAQHGAHCAIDIDGGEEEASELLAQLMARGVKVVEFKIEDVNLEDVFMDVTKGDIA